MARAANRRHGMALVLVLAIALVLSAFGFILSKLSAGARREVDVLTGHFRALSVADAAYAEVISRLSSTGWENRWFKNAPEIRENVQAAGGQFSYLLRDVPGGAEPPPLPGLSNNFRPGQADLIVRASYGKAETVAVWRLMVPQDGLDEASRVVPAVFANVPDGPSTVTPATADPISAMVNAAVTDRMKNWSNFEKLRPKIRDADNPAEIAASLGISAPADIVADSSDESGTKPRPAGYVNTVKAGYQPPPPPPAKAPWTEVPWRNWRAKPGTTSIADRGDRGSDKERDAWDGWPGWPRGGGNDWGGSRRKWDDDARESGGYNPRGRFGGDDGDADDDRFGKDGFGGDD